MPKVDSTVPPPPINNKSKGIIMIETIGIALMSPAALATAPANTPAIETTYDWNTQKEVVLTNGKFDKGNFKLGATMNGTTCWLNGGWVVDDWNSD